MVSMAPAPIAFGAILGLLTFPGFVYYSDDNSMTSRAAGG